MLRPARSETGVYLNKLSLTLAIQCPCKMGAIGAEAAAHGDNGRMTADMRLKYHLANFAADGATQPERGDVP